MTQPDQPSQVTGGIDTHKDIHVAAVIDRVGRVVAVESFPATRPGYGQLLAWSRSGVRCGGVAQNTPILSAGRGDGRTTARRL
jgi:hypothetical protein